MLQVNFIIIYIIHKILALVKITVILKRYLRSVIDFYFSINKPGLAEENIIKDVRGPFRLKEKLKKGTTDTAIKNIKIIFRQEKETQISRQIS